MNNLVGVTEHLEPPSQRKIERSQHISAFQFLSDAKEAFCFASSYLSKCWVLGLLENSIHILETCKLKGEILEHSFCVEYFML